MYMHPNQYMVWLKKVEKDSGIFWVNAAVPCHSAVGSPNKTVYKNQQLPNTESKKANLNLSAGANR
jgi:hypothetical protein